MVSGRDKAALISRSDIYVLPSYSEGFSVSVLENLAARKPVLITPGCNFPEVVDAGAGLCVPPQRDLLAQGLRQLLDMSDSDREQMGRRGRDLVMNNYTWEMAARKLITVYNCILTGKEIPLFPEPIELDANGKPLLT
jgi:glycosyltransferase involved in cell wall biosynthesis